MKTKLNRFLSMLLCLTMVLGMVPAFRLFAVSEATEQTHAIHASSELTEENGLTRISVTLTASALTGNVYLTDDAAIAETVTIPAGKNINLFETNGSGAIVGFRIKVNDVNQTIGADGVAYEWKVLSDMSVSMK